ncbi:MAG: hypothetical protein R6T98_05725, partial [Desulfatiglandales bacterium]
MNPLRAGIVKSMDELNQSPFSGHSALTGSVDRDWQDTRYVLSFFGSSSDARKKYREFVEQGIALGNRPELVGWLEVLALRKMGIRENLRMIPRQMDLARLAEKVCKIHGGSSGEVRS